MTGGVILQWLLDYNFSVAVWVGYIALYGVAVQTGVVKVVYLHGDVDDSRADHHARDLLHHEAACAREGKAATVVDRQVASADVEPPTSTARHAQPQAAL
jgi:Cu/Ag efflux pump CusA